MKKQYYFIVEPYVSISFQRDDVLLYNLLNNEQIRYINCHKIVTFIKELVSMSNLLVLKLNSKHLSDRVLCDFISEARNKLMGDVFQTDWSESQPIQFVPKLKFSRKLDHSSKNIIGEDVLNYLNEITLYINDKCEAKCAVCDNAFKQFIHCTSKNTSSVLNIDTIKWIFDEIQPSFLSKVNICGGNIFLHSEFNSILKIFSANILKSYYVFYENVISNIDSTYDIFSQPKSILKIIVHPSFNYKVLIKIKEKLRFHNENVEYIFLVMTEKDIELVEDAINNLSIDKFIIKPFYSGHNLSFFKKNVFLNIEDITNRKQNIKEVLSKQVLNQINFGKLIINSNHEVYSNVNSPLLFNLRDKTFHEGIYNEIVSGKNWLRTRSTLIPCKSCLYQSLCPPVSNYEYVLNQNDLCNIFKNDKYIN